MSGYFLIPVNSVLKEKSILGNCLFLFLFFEFSPSIKISILNERPRNV